MNNGKQDGSWSHSFLCSNTSSSELLEFDANGKVSWSLKTSGAIFDLWQLDDGRILYSHYGEGGSGARIVDRDGKITFDYLRDNTNEIFSLQPLSDGFVLTGELREKRLAEINPDGKVEKIIPFTYEEEQIHEAMRSVRKLPDGTYMVVSPGLKKILFLNENGTVVEQFQTHPDMFGAAFRKNGNLVYGCMSGIYELDPQGREVWSFTAEDAKEIGICWILGVFLRENGNIIANNWLGHGREGQGVPVFEVTPDKKVVWTCDCRDRVGTLGNFYPLVSEKCENVAKNVLK